MKVIDEMMGWTMMEWLKAAILIGAVLLIGFFALNQYLEFRYSVVLLSTPCTVCRNLNPEVEECFYTIIDNPIHQHVRMEEINMSGVSYQGPVQPDTNITEFRETGIS